MLKLLPAFIAFALHAAPTAPALMPLPARADYPAGEMRIDGGFHVIASGYTDSRLTKAIDRFAARLSRQTGVPFFNDSTGATLTIECAGTAPAYPELGEDESYRLDVDAGGARLTAKTTTGILRGLETLLQLAGPGEKGMRIPAAGIEDHPRFPWRGLMLDVSRHWMPLPVVLRNLDAMAAVKLNVFHWHLADDQGFRVESKAYPKLQQSGSDGHFYTQDDVRRAVEYACDRGIRVIPEFDVPGHTTSWFAAYPELASAPGPYRIERTWGIFKPTMDPAREETYRFLDGLFGEMAGLFPDVNFHIGGDEVDDTQWKGSVSIQAFEKAHGIQSSRALHAYFNRRLQAILKQHGKTLIGWDEILDPSLDSSAIIQSWRGAESLTEAARKGYRTLLSGGYYLDHMQPAARHYAVDPTADMGGLSADQAGRILGGEACMWTEYASSETVDSRIWPRTAAIAERFWSPQQVRDSQSMYERMDQVSRILDFTGIHHRTNRLPMLDRLAAWRDAAALEVLADAVDALGIEGRRNERKYSSSVPLNRFVDAAPPESEAMWALGRSVQSWLATRTAEGAAPIQRTFASWKANPGELRALARHNSQLDEVLPISDRLAATAEIGSGAVAFLQSRQAAPDGWIQSSSEALDRYEKAQAETRLAAVGVVRFLLDALRPAQTGQTNAAQDVRLR